VQLPGANQRSFFEKATALYQSQLQTDAAGQAYLTGRGITAEVAGRFRLGVVRQPIVGHERFGGRLSIPYVTPAGVVNFTFRCLVAQCMRCKASADEGGHAKYLNTQLDTTLYNVGDLATPSQTIHVCEGELDALTLSAAGLPAIGAPGVKNWKPWYSICLADFAEVFVWADPDVAGRKFASFLEKELKARRVALPPGEDCSDYYLRAGAEGLRKLIER